MIQIFIYIALIITSIGSKVSSYHVYRKEFLPAASLPQTWLLYTNDTFDFLKCSIMCSQNFDAKNGCTAFSNLNTSSCTLFMTGPSLVVDSKNQIGKIEVFKRVGQVTSSTGGTVALAIGGFLTPSKSNLDTVETLSTNGNCNHTFTKIPIADYSPMVEILSNKIIFLSAFKSFYQYSFSTSTWDPLPSSSFSHLNRVVKVYQNKFYVMDFANAEVYNPVTMTWSSWSNLPMDLGRFSCSAIYKDTLLVVGGEANGSAILQHNFTQGVWLSLPNLESPMLYPACGFVADNPDIFLIAYNGSGYIFDLKANARTSLTPSFKGKSGSSFVNFGKRTFNIGGEVSSVGTSSFEEYLYSTNSWIMSLSVPKSFFSIINLPSLVLGCN